MMDDVIANMTVKSGPQLEIVLEHEGGVSLERFADLVNSLAMVAVTMAETGVTKSYQNAKWWEIVSLEYRLDGFVLRAAPRRLEVSGSEADDGQG